MGDQNDEPSAVAAEPQATLEQTADTAAGAPRSETPAPDTDAGAATDAFVERWWADHFPGSIVGRSTEVQNYVYAAKEELKARLRRFGL